MREFFHGWRRKVGCVTLAMACVFAGGWVRSEFCEDTIILSDKHGIPMTIIHSLLGILHVSIEEWTGAEDSQIRFLTHYADTLATAGRSETWESWKKTWIREGVATVPVGWELLQIEHYDDRVIQDHRCCGYIIPYWLIVAPLTLLSAYLLLSKPRRATRKQTTEPAPTTGD